MVPAQLSKTHDDLHDEFEKEEIGKIVSKVAQILNMEFISIYVSIELHINMELPVWLY